MNAAKRATAKRAWREMSERARLGHALGFIDALSLLFHQGIISRSDVLRFFNERRITKTDLEAYRRARGLDIQAQVGNTAAL